MTHHASTNTPSAPPTSDSDSHNTVPLHRRIHQAGIVVLVLGLLSAVVIGVVALNNGDNGDSVPDFSGDRRFNYELERLGGKSAIYMAALNRWLGSLWHGTHLAWTVGTLALLVALLCFWLSNFLSYPPLTEPAESPAPGSPESP